MSKPERSRWGFLGAVVFSLLSWGILGWLMFS